MGNSERWRWAVLAATSLVSAKALAIDINTGNPDVKLRWDNSLKYSNGFRLKEASPTLTADPTLDDGDRNFKRGLISNRFDLLSEMDVSYRGFGARVSGAAWYDTVYNRSNDNDSPLTVNSSSVQAGQFPAATKELHGRKGELLDTFVFGGFDAGGAKATFRLGRHTVLWGESLFFGSNGIAAGQAPIDVIKALSVPGTQFKELIRPVPQVSGQLQLSASMSLGAYYQFRWEKTRLPASGSYFSTTDNLGDGAENFLPPGLASLGVFAPAFPPGVAVSRQEDMKAKNSGQGGMQLRLRAMDTDFGLYAIRYHDKTPQLYGRFMSASPTYQWVYPQGIRAFGVSATRSVGDFNLATEMSVRNNMPLASDLSVTTATAGDNAGNPLYAVGKTLHAQFSWLATFGPSFIAQEANFLGEVAWNRRASVTKNAQSLNPNADRDATNVRVSYEPMYRQVIPGLDLSVPVGFGVGFGNSSVVGAFNGDHVGDMSLGLNGTYLGDWRMGLNVTHFFGPAGGAVINQHVSFRQALKDRDFVSLTVQRSF